MANLQFNRRRKEDPVYHAWTEIQEWFAAYGRITAMVVAVVVVVGAGIFFWQRSKVQNEERAGVQLAEAKGLYWRGDYASVIQRTEAIENDFSGTWAATDAIRVRADALFWQGDFPGAIQAYEAFLGAVGMESPILSSIRENLAQAYESDSQFEKAAEVYEESADAESPREVKAERLVDAALAWRAAGSDDRAKELLHRVTREFSDTQSARNAEIALGELGVIES